MAPASVILVTGSGGLVGSEAVRHFAGLGFDVVGIDNDQRRTFFGPDASTEWNTRDLQSELGSRFSHLDVDIRDRDEIPKIFHRYGSSLASVIHAAAQPSHDWAASDPFTDFDVNAQGTLNMLEATRRNAPEAPFVFISTNKVYGDRPNQLSLVELKTRWEVEPGHPHSAGITEEMPIDQSVHSLFGASKAAADLLVQEYGRYFGMPTVCFRAGCLTGPRHSGTRLHGFLSYLMRCATEGRSYEVLGYKGKQVRDNLHSADLVHAIEEFVQSPRAGEVYNIGGGRESHCSMVEAIALCDEITGSELDWRYRDEPRTGDHIWYVSDTTKFRRHYPGWQQIYDVPLILKEIYEMNRDRWTGA